MMKKNGQQIAEQNVRKVKDWIELRNSLRDWNQFSYNDRVNRSLLAAELNFAKSVCTQNKTVRNLLDEADNLWFRKYGEKSAAKEAHVERSILIGQKNSNEAKKVLQRVAELEVENAYLRQKLAAHEKLQQLLDVGVAGFKIE